MLKKIICFGMGFVAGGKIADSLWRYHNKRNKQYKYKVKAVEAVDDQGVFKLKFNHGDHFRVYSTDREDFMTLTILMLKILNITDQDDVDKIMETIHM